MSAAFKSPFQSTSMPDQITTFKEAQKLVRFFAERNGWKDVPEIDKFDHLHEELLEMSRHLRYKPQEERISFVKENKEIFIHEIGDLLFGLCRLANQLGVDLEESFNAAQKRILEKYNHKNPENKIVRKEHSL